jgi:hypothetical protein
MGVAIATPLISFKKQMNWTIKNIGYRCRYYWKEVWNFLGFCPKCWNSVNYTASGRAICPKCGK